MFNPTRDEARRFMLDAWCKYRDRLALTPLEAIFADIAAEHPEYHTLLEDPDALAREYTPEDGQINPFLHLALHLAIHEQLSIDQPPGLRQAYDLCLARHHGDRHAALHDVLECLGETIFLAQKNGVAPDAGAYVECVRQRG